MDITKCTGEGCPVKEFCFRFTAPDSEYRQSYFVEPPMVVEDGKFITCDMYWGEEQESILDLLIDIASGNRTK
jgi:hypothetical protein